jgi:arylsulfatase A-like enzyme
MKKEVSRRVFLDRLGACTLGGTALSRVLSGPAAAQDAAPLADGGGAPGSAVAWTAPPGLANPNILIIVVDQMRWPSWLTSGQMTTLDQVYLPNIFGKIRDNSYSFQQYFVAATPCAPSRSTLLTGLYSPQTALYANDAPALNAAFPTWGQALPVLNSAYQNNVWWFGKWHLSDLVGVPTPLAPYGFNTMTYPGGLATNPFTSQTYYIPSPDGAPNEGFNGGINQAAGTSQGITYASDAMIVDDFSGWLQGQAPSSGPWCATVSLINPHDIAWAPGWFSSTLPPPGLPGLDKYFPSDFPSMPPPNSPPELLAANPSPWNWENLLNKSHPHYVGNKPSLQYSFLRQMNSRCGPVTNWTTFLNQYYWLQNFVDQQVGRVLDALNNSPYAGNTIVIFTSDHGEYGGSHGLHDKAGAVYDESLHVPLCIQFPGQKGSTAMPQMCSSVDFFGLICDLSTGGGGLWRTAYPDLGLRQSVWDFLYTNASETRTITVGPGAQAPAIPFALHTVDQTDGNEYCPPGPAVPPDNRHIVCLRTKYNARNPSPGAKLGVYSHWAPNNTCWDTTTPQEFEFYDYNPQTTRNGHEIGNDYYSSNATTQTTIASYQAALGGWGPPPWGFNGSGLIASELDRPLVGTGTDGNPLTQAQAAAQQAFCSFSNPCQA